MIYSAVTDTNEVLFSGFKSEKIINLLIDIVCEKYPYRYSKDRIVVIVEADTNGI